MWEASKEKRAEAGPVSVTARASVTGTVIALAGVQRDGTRTAEKVASAMSRRSEREVRGMNGPC